MHEIHVAIIGSTVVDVILNIPHLPVCKEDVNVSSQQLAIGGCAYNTSTMLAHFQVPYILFSPIGQGIYGDFIKHEFRNKDITSIIPSPMEENGCCYCFVEDSGERTFVSYHGAEYKFKKEWFSALDAHPIDTVYICGLELEEESAHVIIEYLEEHPTIQIYFAPGPRIHKINHEYMNRIFALSPILHLNEEEACCYTGHNKLDQSAVALYQQTKQAVIITLGKDGTYVYDGQESTYISTRKAIQIDTIGAGDSHIGSIIACVTKGMPIIEAIRVANMVASSVVEVKGATLSHEEFKNLQLTI